MNDSKKAALQLQKKYSLYVDNAKLQVKATLNCSNLDLEHFMLTPVIVFDFDHGIKKLKERYPYNPIYSAYDLFPEVLMTA